MSRMTFVVDASTDAEEVAELQLVEDVLHLRDICRERALIGVKGEHEMRKRLKNSSRSTGEEHRHEAHQLDLLAVVVVARFGERRVWLDLLQTL